MSIGLVLLIIPELATNCKRRKKTRKKTTDSSTVEQNDVSVALNLKAKQSKKKTFHLLFISNNLRKSKRWEEKDIFL